jgi:hypothetical protein
VLSHSPSKREKALAMGADRFVLSSDKEQMAAAATSIKFIIDTVSADHQVSKFLPLLKAGGTLVLVGMPGAKMQIGAYYKASIVFVTFTLALTPTLTLTLTLTLTRQANVPSNLLTMLTARLINVFLLVFSGRRSRSSGGNASYLVVELGGRRSRLSGGNASYLVVVAPYGSCAVPPPLHVNRVAHSHVNCSLTVVGRSRLFADWLLRHRLLRPGRRCRNHHAATQLYRLAYRWDCRYARGN